MSLSSFLILSEEEKELLTKSIGLLTGKLDLLVERFYFYFLRSNQEITKLFSNTNMLKQQNMFNVAIGAIITNIDNPTLIQNSLDQYIQKHRLYGVEIKHISFFIDSLTKAFTEVFSKDDPIMKAWLKLFYDVMEYFKSKL